VLFFSMPQEQEVLNGHIISSISCKTNKNKKFKNVSHFKLATLSEIKVQKLSLGRYLFKRYMFVPKGSSLVP